MSNLNYNHLYYFYMAAKEGGVSKAALRLRLAQPTISAQIKQLEQALGHELFEKTGRGLVLTQIGKRVYAEADKIFQLGSRLEKELKTNSRHLLTTFSLGIPDTLPKMLITTILARFLQGSTKRSVYCREGTIEVLISLLLERKIDLIVTDMLPPVNLKVKIYKQYLGKSKVGIFSRLSRDRFERLRNIPAIVPIKNSGLRSLIEEWNERQIKKIQVIAEVEDSALAKNLASDVNSVIFEVVAIEKEILKKFNLKKIEEIDEEISYYAITLDKKNQTREIEEFLKIVTQSFLRPSD